MEYNLPDFDKLAKKEKINVDLVKSSLKVLTSIEKGILQFLLDLSNPQTIKGIRSLFILNYGKFFNEMYKNKVNPFLWMPDIKGLSTEKIKKISESYEKIMNNLEYTPTQRIRELNKLLSSFKVRVPSQEVIEKALNNLKQMNIVGYRETPEKRSKGIWYINPNVDFVLNKLKK